MDSGHGAIRRCAERRHDCADDEPADVVGWHSSMSGVEWFLMWQSKIWNAFRMFTIVGVVFLVVVQREPTPD